MMPPTVNPPMLPGQANMMACIHWQSLLFFKNKNLIVRNRLLSQSLPSTMDDDANLSALSPSPTQRFTFA